MFFRYIEIKEDFTNDQNGCTKFHYNISQTISHKWRHQIK